MLTKTRWLLLKRPENLADKRGIKLTDLLQYNLHFAALRIEPHTLLQRPVRNAAKSRLHGDNIHGLRSQTVEPLLQYLAPHVKAPG